MLKKTNFIIFCSVQKKYDASKITINLIGNKIELLVMQNPRSLYRRTSELGRAYQTDKVQGVKKYWSLMEIKI